jgi:hypothetical protein
MSGDFGKLVLLKRKSGKDGVSRVLSDTKAVIGKASNAEIRLQCPGIERRHAMLMLNENGKVGFERSIFSLFRGLFILPVSFLHPN